MLLFNSDRMILRELTLIDLEAFDFGSVLKGYLGELGANPSHKQQRKKSHVSKQ